MPTGNDTDPVPIEIMGCINAGTAKNRDFFDILQIKQYAFSTEWQLYFLCLPGLPVFLIFHYLPIYKIQIAIKGFMFMKGIVGSPWAGLRHFHTFLSSY